jgi:hypothetical protein
MHKYRHLGLNNCCKVTGVNMMQGYCNAVLLRCTAVSSNSMYWSTLCLAGSQNSVKP